MVMSSYFDTMGRCFYDKEAISDLVLKQYRAYLSELQDNVVPEDEDKLGDLMVELFEIERHCNGRPETMVSCIHDLAHKVGSAGLRMKDGSYAGDNPRMVY